MLTTSSRQLVELKAKLFRGFADPSRLSILEALAQGEKTVSDLVMTTGLSQSNVSNHLACLRDCGLVSARPDGRFTVYSLADSTVKELLTQAGDLLLRAAQGVYECVNYAPVDLSSKSPDGEA